uniref:Putative secreted peptide n=1 Tax=Anopheles braziliensis TaxID=58242 RepID=A0A2M3ZNY9_9DIPT
MVCLDFIQLCMYVCMCVCRNVCTLFQSRAMPPANLPTLREARVYTSNTGRTPERFKEEKMKREKKNQNDLVVAGTAARNLYLFSLSNQSERHVVDEAVCMLLPCSVLRVVPDPGYQGPDSLYTDLNMPACACVCVVVLIDG